MLQNCLSRLESRFDVLNHLYSEVYCSMPKVGLTRYQRLHAFEGLLSHAWQSWCGFCRQVSYLSLTGTVTVTGTVTHPKGGISSYGRMAYIAKQLSRRNAIKAGNVLQPHSEPTWGDQTLLLDLFQYLCPTNATALESGLKLTYPAAGHMRTVRNAAAHLSSSTFADVQRIMIYYSGSYLKHPLDLLTWEEKTSNEPAFLVWLADLREIAENMTQ